MQQTSPIDIITQQLQTLSLEQLLQVRENINALISEKSPRFSAYLGSDHTETTYQAVVTDANYYTADILDSTIRDQLKASVKAFLQKHQIKAEINQPIALIIDSKDLLLEDQSLEGIIKLVDEWINDESGYDEETYPQIEIALNQKGLSL